MPDYSKPIIESLESRALLAGTISGVIFDDLNGNGVRETGEPGLAQQRIFIDLNFDGTQQQNEPTLLTDSNGNYSFTNRPNGIQRVRYAVPTGRRLTAPAAIFYDVAVANQVTSGRNFGSTDTAVVTGIVFSDLNENGRLDPGEPGLPGWTLFLDKNNNNKIDSNEKVRITNSQGRYRFTGLTPGTYNLKIVQQTGFTRINPLNGLFRFTAAAAQSFSNRNFAQTIDGGSRP